MFDCCLTISTCKRSNIALELIKVACNNSMKMKIKTMKIEKKVNKLSPTGNDV